MNKIRIFFLLLLFVRGLCAQKVTISISPMEKENIKIVSDLTLSGAKKLIDFGLLQATDRKLNLAIAVTDRSGNLLAFVRMDKAAFVTTDVAIGKARSAAYLKAPSKVFENLVNSGLPSMVTTPGILPLQGGVSVIYNGEVIGGIGVSGSSGSSGNEIASLIVGALK